MFAGIKHRDTRNPGKVVDIKRGDGGDSMSQHRRRRIKVENFRAPRTNPRKEANQPCTGFLRRIEQAECGMSKITPNFLSGHGRGHRAYDTAWIRNDGVELKKNLMRQASPDTACESGIAKRPCNEMLWGVRIVRVDQHIGVNEHLSNGLDRSPPGSGAL